MRSSIFIFHLLNLFLIYKISKFFLKKLTDRLLTILIYSLIPGVISFALIINPSTIVISFTLLFIYFYLNKKRILSYFILILSLFIDNSFEILFLSLIFYSLITKEKKLIYLSIVLLILSLYFFGFESSGKPKGYFLDTLGVYAIIFSPPLFLYFFYVLYRDLALKKLNILWAISFFSLLLSLLLSLRQKIALEDFAPFVVISIPLLLNRYFSSLRVRLVEFRRWYKIIGITIMVGLIINLLIISFNSYLYLILSNPKNHFAYKFHFVKDLSIELKKLNINSIKCDDKKLQLRLKFYNIYVSNSYLLSENQRDNYLYKVTISNNGKINKIFYVSKINKE